MEIIFISDTLTSIASNQAGLSWGFSKFLISSSDQSSGPLQISAAMFPIVALAPPPVKSNRVRTLPRRLINKRRRTRKRSLAGDDDNGDGNEVFGFFGDGGDGDGPFSNNNGGSGGGGSGGSWNFGWEEFFSNNNNNSYHDPAFDFVYEVLSWIVLSNCLHFAFKKVERIVTDGFSDPSREKVPMRLESVC